jgi:hypothetical protein
MINIMQEAAQGNADAQKYLGESSGEQESMYDEN